MNRPVSFLQVSLYLLQLLVYGITLEAKTGLYTYPLPIHHAHQLVAVYYEWGNCPHGLIVFRSLQIVWYFCMDTPLHSPSSCPTFQHCTVFCKLLLEIQSESWGCVSEIPYCPEIPYAMHWSSPSLWNSYYCVNYEWMNYKIVQGVCWSADSSKPCADSSKPCAS